MNGLYESKNKAEVSKKRVLYGNLAPNPSAPTSFMITIRPCIKMSRFIPSREILGIMRTLCILWTRPSHGGFRRFQKTRLRGLAPETSRHLYSMFRSQTTEHYGLQHFPRRMSASLQNFVSAVLLPTARMIQEPALNRINIINGILKLIMDIIPR